MSNLKNFFTDKKIIGIDPGKSGGISVYSLTKGCLIEAVPMPETAKDLHDYLKLLQVNSVCVLEKVQGLPKMGGSSMFNFGKGFGHLEMALISLNIKTFEVTPQVWQKTFQLGTKGNKSTTEWKNKLKFKAQQLYPKVKVTLAISDSLLILEYGIEKYGKL